MRIEISRCAIIRDVSPFASETVRAPGVIEPALSSPINESSALELAELLQALGDPNRLRILTALGTACVPVGAIVTATGLRQPAVSHHLRVLRDRGVVRSDRRGAYIYYCASSDLLRSALELVQAVLADQARP